jgi:hypothetical protein
MNHHIKEKNQISPQKAKKRHLYFGKKRKLDLTSHRLNLQLTKSILSHNSSNKIQDRAKKEYQPIDSSEIYINKIPGLKTVL